MDPNALPWAKLFISLFKDCTAVSGNFESLYFCGRSWDFIRQGRLKCFSGNMLDDVPAKDASKVRDEEKERRQMRNQCRQQE